MDNQNKHWTFFLAASILGIISTLLIFFDLYSNTGLALLILATVISLTGFLLGASMNKGNLYVLASTLIGLTVLIFHFLVGSVETAILFMVVVYSVGFLLVVVPKEKKETKAEEIKHIMKSKARKEESTGKPPTIQIVNEETDKIYRELEKIEEDLKKLEEDEKKKTATKKKSPKKKASKKKKKRKKKKKAAKKKSTKKKTTKKKKTS